MIGYGMGYSITWVYFFFIGVMFFTSLKHPVSFHTWSPTVPQRVCDTATEEKKQKLIFLIFIQLVPGESAFAKFPHLADFSLGLTFRVTLAL